MRDCKESGTSNLFTSAGNLVEKLLTGKMKEFCKIKNLPTVDRLSRKTNRKRCALKQKNNIEQVPLAFIFMTGKPKKDYKLAFEAFRDLLLPESGVLDAIVMDYEAAIWSGVRKVFPDINIKGCSCHYTQAIFRKVQEIGLHVQYVSELNVEIVRRQLMALTYLPTTMMVDEFKDLYCYCQADEKLTELYIYVNDTWMNNSIWSIEEICVVTITCRIEKFF